MTTFDDHKNFASTTVTAAPSPSTSGTSMDVDDGTVFPTVPFNAVVWPANVTAPTDVNAEIVRVTNIATDTLTITRTQEGTSARSIQVGDRVMAAITDKTLTDIEDAVNAISAAIPLAQQLLTGPTGTYTPGATVLAFIVEAVGAGGGGGGAVGVGAQCAAAGGGGAGAYSRRLYSGPFGTMSYDYVVGVGGTGGATGTDPGGDGGDTIFDTAALFSLFAGGGFGGDAGPSGTTPAVSQGGSGGIADGTTGDLLVHGGEGGNGLVVSGTVGISGSGGGNTLAGTTTGEISDGSATGFDYGGGGNGGLTTNTPDASGGDGADGILVITEYGTP